MPHDLLLTLLGDFVSLCVTMDFMMPSILFIPSFNAYKIRLIFSALGDLTDSVISDISYYLVRPCACWCAIWPNRQRPLAIKWFSFEITQDQIAQVISQYFEGNVLSVSMSQFFGVLVSKWFEVSALLSLLDSRKRRHWYAQAYFTAFVR